MQPSVHRLTAQQHRHTVVILCQQCIRRAGQNRTAQQRLRRPLWLPAFPQARKGKRPSIPHPEIVRLTRPFLPFFLLPLKKAICGDQTPLGLKRPPERRFLRRRLRPCIDHLAAHAGIFSPKRHQPPPHPFHQPARPLADHPHHLSGRRVVTRLPIRRRALQVKSHLQAVRINGDRKPSAHLHLSLPNPNHAPFWIVAQPIHRKIIRSP